MLKDNKHDLTPLYLFAGGFLFYAVAVPCLDSISAVFQSACNKLVTKWQLDLNERAAESEAAVAVIQPAEYSNVNAVGFQIPSEEDDEEYYE